MATPAQIAANQANAQKSTGPTTEAGKAKCSRNATRHGLCRFIPCMDDEETSEARALLADLNEEYQPQGPTEEILVYKMAEQFWLTNRASWALAEATRNNLHCDEEEEPGTQRQLALYLRYYTTADRAFNKNLADLRKLQKERRQREAEEAIGSVSQNAEPPQPKPDSPAQPTPPAIENLPPVTPIRQISTVASPKITIVNRPASRKEAA